MKKPKDKVFWATKIILKFGIVDGAKGLTDAVTRA